MLNGSEQQLRRLSDLQHQLRDNYTEDEQEKFLQIEQLEKNQQYREAGQARDQLSVSEKPKLIQWVELRRNTTLLENTIRNCHESYTEIDLSDESNGADLPSKKSKGKCTIC